jgi:hypothetical protein
MKGIRHAESVYDASPESTSHSSGGGLYIAIKRKAKYRFHAVIMFYILFIAIKRKAKYRFHTVTIFYILFIAIKQKTGYRFHAVIMFCILQN